jgi:NAD(P)-dependent dehydrogenase (short-subunit alcohol dehydrogenase family)
MIIDFSGKTALITGSTAGIGYAIAKGLAASGAEIVINGRGHDRVDAAVAKLKQGVADAKVRGIAADVSTAAGCDQLLDALPEIDILINNAGIFEPKDFFETPDEDWQRYFDINVMSGVRLSRARLSLRDAEAQLRPHRLHLLRIRTGHPARHDCLRYDQDGAACGFARDCKAHRRHRGDGQFGAAGADDVGGHRKCAGGGRKAERPVGGGDCGELFEAA